MKKIAKYVLFFMIGIITLTSCSGNKNPENTIIGKEYKLGKTGYKVNLENEFNSGKIDSDTSAILSAKDDNGEIISFSLEDLNENDGKNISEYKDNLNKRLGSSSGTDVKVGSGKLLDSESVEMFIVTGEGANLKISKSSTAILGEKKYTLTVFGKDEKRIAKDFEQAIQSLNNK